MVAYQINLTRVNTIHTINMLKVRVSLNVLNMLSILMFSHLKAAHLHIR